MTAAEASGYLADGEFPKGSMGPKIEAAVDFLARGGEEVLITTPAALERAIAGETGTRIAARTRSPPHSANPERRTHMATVEAEPYGFDFEIRRRRRS